MRNLRWICWYLWEGLPTLLAFPIDPSKTSGTGDSWFTHWEDHWPRYAIGTLGFVVVAFTLAGCLCCRRQRCPKGFQEFKDGSTAGTETTIERHPSTSLELEVPRIASSSLTSSGKLHLDLSQIDRLPVDSRTIAKPKPPSPSLFSDEQDIETNFSREQPCREWFEAVNCHVPRERLKYLREIGRGWFGKVVEGTTESPDNSSRNRGVVVRILTEEATSREKAWFLGEATPYLKLQHPNILTLLGSCLEADPYLLLFESCPAGDLKGFLRSNRDRGTCEALRKQNVPTRMALDVANALEHMHDNGFAHTDLSARNCLVAPDLSAKLGDYGTGVERYPDDYYVVGDRALPIRWSAPESLECTATTMETRAITPRANLWSYGVLLWEMATWGERPYDDLGDEQVIEMIFSLKSDFSPHASSLAMLEKLRVLHDVPENFAEAVEGSWRFFPDDRSSLTETRRIIRGKGIEDFERRWENLRPNGASHDDRERDNGSSSLRDPRSGAESETNFFEEKISCAPQARFRLGPDEPVESLPSAQRGGQESGSETEEESWRGRVERGAYTEKVKQKSKSVADLMVLVHIDSDSEAEISLGPQTTEKSTKKRLPASGSDGDLRSAVLADEFDEAIRKLREPSACNGSTSRTTKGHLENPLNTENLDKPKLLTLTQQGKTPILRLSFGHPENLESSTMTEKIENRHNFSSQRNIFKNLTTELFDCEEASKISSMEEKSKMSSMEEKSRVDDFYEKTGNSVASSPRREEKPTEEDAARKFDSNARTESPRVEGHVLRLVSKGDPDLPLLRYVPESASTPAISSAIDEPSRFDSFLVFEPRDSSAACFSNDFDVPRVEESSVNVELWNDVLALELEKKKPVYDVGSKIFENFENSIAREAVGRTSRVSSCLTDGDNLKTETSASVPTTPKNRGDSTMGSSSAPETPRSYRRAEIDEGLVNGSSSAAVYSVGNIDEDSSTGEELEASERIVKGSASAPDTPQSRGNYSVVNGDEDSSTGEDLESGMTKRSSNDVVDDEEDRKHLSTPDDERSSDSGFRDKESCEEEESPVPGPTVSSTILPGKISGHATSSSPLSASAEEEQMRILFELDTILDAEYYGSFNESDKLEDGEISSPSNVRVRFVENEEDEIGAKNRSISESLESTESTEVVETVRANSCEPDLLDSRSSREIAREESRKIGDFLSNDGPEDGRNRLEISDATEADSTSESSPKTDRNRSVESSSSLRANERRSLSADSEKNRSTDSSIELRGFNVDSSVSLGKLDGSNESADTSGELRSYDRSSDREDLDETNESSPIHESADLADSNGDSSLKSEKIPSTHLSVDHRRSDASELFRTSEIESSDSTSRSPLITDLRSDDVIDRVDDQNLPSDSAITDRNVDNLDKLPETSEIGESSEIYFEHSTGDSPLKTDRCRNSDLSMELREADSVRSDVERWSSRENIDENENDDEDSSTMSLRSDNSYVSFGLDEEFVTAIRNELREKLPRAQMPVVEALDPRDDKEPSVNEDAEAKRWEDEEADENSESGSGGVDISIRYNIYGTPLSPILEERESAGTSESLVSKEDSRDASIASRVSALSEDVLVVDTRTNRAMMLEGNASGNGESANFQHDDDRDTSHGDFSDEENLDYPQNNLNRGMESKIIPMGSGGAPLPSPEEESKWQQQFPLPLQMQDDLMSTSFGTDRDWDSQDEEEGDDDGEDGEDDEEENSSSSGEFVWKRYDESHGDLENVATRSPPNKPKSQEPEADLEEEDEGDEEEEEEFTPSAWDATLAPHRSALRSPEKTLKSGDQKKSVWFKKQRYHCVYEYPKETPVAEGQGQAGTTWASTSYADWEEIMDEPRLDVYPVEYDETNRAGDEEFYVSSSNRPFQFQSGEGKYVSQFFPGASPTLLQHQQQPPSREAEDCQESQDEVDRADVPLPQPAQPAQTNGNSRCPEFVDNQQQIQQSQLGELRHTRDRLKLNLLSTSGAAKTEEDVGNETRSLDVGEIENLNSENSRTPRKETEAPANAERSKAAEELSKYKKSMDLKATETEIVEEFSTEMAKSPEGRSEDKKSLDLKTVSTDTVEDSSKKTAKSVKDKCEEEPSAEMPIEEESSKTAKELSDHDEKSIESSIGEKITLKRENICFDSNESGASSSPKNRDNLAVRDASTSDENNEFLTKADGTRDKFPSDDLAVIRAKDETDGEVETALSTIKGDSRMIGDQKDSSNSRTVEATGTFVSGQIVDIAKLETEESPSIARRRVKADDIVIVEKSENEKFSSVRDAKAVPSTIRSTDERTDEDFVQSSQS